MPIRNSSHRIASLAAPSFRSTFDWVETRTVKLEILPCCGEEALYEDTWTVEGPGAPLRHFILRFDSSLGGAVVAVADLLDTLPLGEGGSRLELLIVSWTAEPWIGVGKAANSLHRLAAVTELKVQMGTDVDLGELVSGHDDELHNRRVRLSVGRDGATSNRGAHRSCNWIRALRICHASQGHDPSRDKAGDVLGHQRHHWPGGLLGSLV